MPAINDNFESKPFLSIIGGTLKQKVDEGTPGAKYREYETPSGVKGSKWEISYSAWRGKIEDLRIHESEYGDALHVVFEDCIISIPLTQRYFADFVKKIASANLDKEVTIKPYDYVNDEGKRKSGLVIVQDEEKLKDHFYDFDTKKYSDGFPEAGDIKSKDEWRIYFMQVNVFLKNWVLLHPINNINTVPITPAPVGTMHDEEEIDLSSVPF